MHHALATLASGHPLIDIDGTVFIQFGLFLIVLVVTRTFLFKPYLELRKRRTATIDGARVEADRTAAEAEAKLADYETKLAAARSRANVPVSYTHLTLPTSDL